MKFIKLLFICVFYVSSQTVYQCDFDYGEKCLIGLEIAPPLILNENSEEPRRPVSDVSAISRQKISSFSSFPIDFRFKKLQTIKENVFFLFNSTHLNYFFVNEPILISRQLVQFLTQQVRESTVVKVFLFLRTFS